MTQPELKPVPIAQETSRYESRFPLEMALLRIGGVYPRSEEPLFNPYTEQKEADYFGNIGEHCVAVARCAEVMATSVFGENTPQAALATRRALVHDANKGFEIMRKTAVRNGVINDAYSPSAYETIRPLLEQQGVAPDTIQYMAHAGAETGHNSFKDFVKLSQDGTPSLKTDDVDAMIVHLADDMTFTPIVAAGESADTYYLTAAERQAASDFPNRYPFLYKEGFGFDAQENVVMVKDVATPSDLKNVKTYAEWQLWIAKEMAAHLVSRITNEPVENPEVFLKNLVNSTLE